MRVARVVRVAKVKREVRVNMVKSLILKEKSYVLAKHRCINKINK